MRALDIYIDGASKGNPGHAGIGVIVCRDGDVIRNVSQYIGQATNNVAEYTAFIFGLQEAMILKAEEVNVFTDSELLFRQIKKEYKVKNANIVGLYSQAEHLIAYFKDFSIKHIPREENSGADKLATKAIKEAISKK